MGTLQWLCKSLYKDVMYFGNPLSRSVEGTVQTSVSKFSNFFVAMLFKAVMCYCCVEYLYNASMGGAQFDN